MLAVLKWGLAKITLFLDCELRIWGIESPCFGSWFGDFPPSKGAVSTWKTVWELPKLQPGNKSHRNKSHRDQRVSIWGLVTPFSLRADVFPPSQLSLQLWWQHPNGLIQSSCSKFNRKPQNCFHFAQKWCGMEFLCPCQRNPRPGRWKVVRGLNQFIMWSSNWLQFDFHL